MHINTRANAAQMPALFMPVAAISAASAAHHPVQVWDGCACVLGAVARVRHMHRYLTFIDIEDVDGIAWGGEGTVSFPAPFA